jgi:hypothetical protein
MMSRRAARLALAAYLVAEALLPGSVLRAQETLAWTEKASEGFISLSYGSLDASQQPIFQLSCFNEMEIAVLNVFGAIDGVRPGQKLEIELAAGGAKAALEGEASLDDKTGAIFAEASGIEVQPLLAVLKSPGPLTLKVAETSRTLSDAGRADAVAKFSKDCTLE